MNYVVKKGKPLQAHFAQISFIYRIWLQTHQQTSQSVGTLQTLTLIMPTDP